MDWGIIGLIAYLIAMVGAFAAVGWWIHKDGIALNVASEQRSRLIGNIFKSENWRELSDDLDDVAFRDHIAAVRKGRDWRTIYSRRIQAMLAAREAAKNVVLQ